MISKGLCRCRCQKRVVLYLSSRAYYVVLSTGRHSRGRFIPGKHHLKNDFTSDLRVTVDKQFRPTANIRLKVVIYLFPGAVVSKYWT